MFPMNSPKDVAPFIANDVLEAAMHAISGIAYWLLNSVCIAGSYVYLKLRCLNVG